MIIVAILKHIAGKSADYGAALDYLKYEHDEVLKRPLLDANGNWVLRRDILLEGIQQLGVPGHLLEQISLDQCFRHTVKAVSVCFKTFEIRVLHVNSSPPVCRIGFALFEITVHSYGGTRFLAPPQCICCYLSFAILPQPVPAPYFSGVFSGKTRRMHIQCQKYLSGMAYSVVKELL